MITAKQCVQRALGQFGYQLCRVSSERRRPSEPSVESPKVVSAMDPVWPLPHGNKSMPAEQIRQQFAKYDAWHYPYEFEDGLSFPARSNRPGPLTADANRPLQRFRHIMPHLLASQNGSLRGKRVLDVACNSGFWSMQCALLGADVVGFDARPELIEQANLVKSIVGVKNVEYRLLNFWDMSPEPLGGMFDVVLSLGILYHLPKPLEALQRTTAMARECVLLDTEIYPSTDSLIKLRWEQPISIRSANCSGIVALPSKSGIDLMLRDIGVAEWEEIPLRSEMPPDYMEGRRASWLIKVSEASRSVAVA